MKFTRQASDRVLASLFLASLIMGLFLLPSSITFAQAPAASAQAILVLGAGGEPEFDADFKAAFEMLRDSLNAAGLDVQIIAASEQDAASDRDGLEAAIKTAALDDSREPLWIVMIGHGTWDGKRANFNLTGPDVSATQLKDWLRPIKRPIVLVNCSSSSAPFIDRLSGPGRVIVTATKSGSEQNVTRFARFFAAAIRAAEADLDHDDATSVREAFIKASSDVQNWYREQGRLASEHALLDDNGDRKGSSAEIVRGKAKLKDASQRIDGDEARRWAIPQPEKALAWTQQQIEKRDRLEGQLQALKLEHKDDTQTLREAALPVLTKLAKLYAEVEAATEKRATDKEN